MRTRYLLLVGVLAVVGFYASSRSSRSPTPPAPPELAPSLSIAQPAPPEHVDPHVPSSHAAVRTDLDRQIDDKLARDPIAQAIPMLFDYTKEKQLETLYWLKYAPRQKLAAFFPRLGEGAELSIHEREQLALDLIDGFITDLEREGVKAHRF